MASSYCSVVLGDVLVKRARMLTAILSLLGVVPTLTGGRSTDEKLPAAVAISLRRVAARFERAATNLRSRGPAGGVVRSRQAPDAYVVLRARPPGPPFRRQGPRRVGGLRPPREAQGMARFATARSTLGSGFGRVERFVAFPRHSRPERAAYGPALKTTEALPTTVAVPASQRGDGGRGPRFAPARLKI